MLSAEGKWQGGSRWWKNHFYLCCWYY